MHRKKMSNRERQAKKLIATIYDAVNRLGKLFPGRHFTPDGIMVGSLGEVLAEIKYNIRLLPPNTPKHDAQELATDRFVQIRTNQGDTAPLREKPDHFLALKLLRDGTIKEIYNGSGSQAWKIALEVKPDPNGFHHIRHNKLIKAMQKPGIRITERTL
jgi:hypothetical protein